MSIEELITFSPTLADKLAPTIAGSTRSDIAMLAAKILEIVDSSAGVSALALSLLLNRQRGGAVEMVPGR